MSDDALETVADFFELMEITSLLPAQQRQVYVFLLDKSSGGTRPIGLFTALYRLWSKTRQTDAAKWAGEHDRAFYAAGKGRSTIDPIWRKAVKSQLAREPEVHVATLGWDMRKFYEMIVHDKLRAQAKKYNFPMQIIEMAISAYCMGRVITYDGLASGELYPTRGIVAGDSLSDILIKLYYTEAFDQHAAEYGDVDLQVYFDDMQLSMEAKASVIETRFVEAAESLHRRITFDLEATLAMDKATIACTCPVLCRRLRDQLGDVAGAPVQLTAFLGVDDLNGKVRAELAQGSKWKDRIGKHKARRGKVSRLAGGSKTGAVKVFVAGVVPESTYGVEVHGLANGELDGLRSTAKLAMTPGGRARSASALFVARGDPTWRPALAPVLRWAQEAWWTVAPRGAATQALKPTLLRQAWEEASKAFPRSWTHVRGPIDAAVLSASRIGWSFEGPFTLVSDQGVKIQLFETSPRLLSKLLRAAMQRHWQAKMATKLEPEGFAAKRVCPDPIRMVINSGWAKKCKLEAFTAVKAFCGGIWTTTRAAAAGYIIDDLTCPLCHEEEDTIEHRLLRCPKCKTIRDSNKSTCKIIQDNIKTDKLLATRGIMAHPADDARLPPSDGGISITRSGFDGDPNELLREVGGDWGFCDGSASRHPVEELRRAAWAAAFLDADGNVQVKITGPVWANLPQTPQAAEYIGAVAAIKVMTRPTTLVGDCLGMIHSVNKVRASCTPEGAYGGVLKSIARGGRFTNLVDFLWTPAHTVLKDDATPRERLLHKGNDLVDAGAKEARLSVEDSTGANVLKDAEADCRRAVKILKTVGTILAQWPAMARGMERSQNATRGQLTIGHDWSFAPQLGYWRCCDCGLFSHNAASKGPPLTAGPCRPGRAEQRDLEAARLGHMISSVHRCGVPVTYCQTCGAHGSWRWDSLLKPCTGVPANYQARLWLSKAIKGEDITMQLSRNQARAIAKVTRKYNKLGQKAKVAKPNGYEKSQKAMVDEPKGYGGLRNKRAATLEVKKGWEARLTKTPEEPTPGAPGPHEPLAYAVAAADDERTQPGLQQMLRPPQPVLRLKPWTGNSDEPDESCPRCCATVLPSDWLCAQCGLERAAAEENADVKPNDVILQPIDVPVVDIAASSSSTNGGSKPTKTRVATPAGSRRRRRTAKPQGEAVPGKEGPSQAPPAHVTAEAGAEDVGAGDLFGNLFPNAVRQSTEPARATDQPPSRAVLKSALKSRGAPTSMATKNKISFGSNPPMIPIASMRGQNLWWSAAELDKPKRGRPPGKTNARPAGAGTRQQPEQADDSRALPNGMPNVGNTERAMASRPDPARGSTSTVAVRGENVGARPNARTLAASRASTPESRSHSPASPRDAAHAHVLSMVSMRVGGEEHPSRPPISAAERMAALRERVLAKASTKGQ